MTYKAIEVAKWLITEASRQGLKITPMQLQKILYYCQGEFLGMTGTPLFNDPVLAWEHGPVVRSVYDAFRSFGSSPINLQHPTTAPEELKNFIRHCVMEKGKMSASQLRCATHREPPYKETMHNEEITQDKMKKYFAEQFYGEDEEDVYAPEFSTEKEAMAAIAKNFNKEELDELISLL